MKLEIDLNRARQVADELARAESDTDLGIEAAVIVRLLVDEVHRLRGGPPDHILTPEEATVAEFLRIRESELILRWHAWRAERGDEPREVAVPQSLPARGVEGSMIFGLPLVRAAVEQPELR